jgi:cytochrome c
MKKVAAFFMCFSLLVTPAFGFDSADTSISETGDPEAGRVVFQKCGACHNLERNAAPTVGPNLDNIFGRIAGTSESYTGYSKALRDSGIVWSEKELDNWLRDPNNYLPGNKMPFAGLRAEQDRADLIAYIRNATE